MYVLCLPTVATIQAYTSHVYFQTNLYRGTWPLLNVMFVGFRFCSVRRPDVTVSNEFCNEQQSREVSVFYTTPQKYANVPMNIYKSHYFNINEGFQIIFLASTKYMGIAESGELSTSTGDPIQWAESGLKLGYNPLTHNTLTKQFLLSKIQIKFSLE